jgi:N,N'-diacetyllegionaminate synthase
MRKNRVTRLFETKPFIIAEVGSNWRTLVDCLDSIRVAKECGADAVKFQAFNRAALYGPDGLMVNGEWCPAQTYGKSMPGELPLGWLPTLKAKADEAGIEFMCTAFSPELVAAVDPYVEVHKVASSDAAWPQLSLAVAMTGKPVLISLGAKSKAEGFKAVEDLVGHLGRKNVFVLGCVASYPADYVDLREFGDYPSKWGDSDDDYYREGMRYPKYWDGLSDHTLGLTVAVDAARKGVKVIEKHFTAFPDLDTPDRPHSLTPTQFKRMVDIIRGREVESEEKDMYLRHNRRLIATRDIAVGDILKYGSNYGAYRSLKDDTRGLSPFDWERVEGREASVSIARGDSIGEGDFT